MISVLIVEDDPLIAEAHRTYLGSAGRVFGGGGGAHRPRRACGRRPRRPASDTDRPGAARPRPARRQRHRLASALSGLRPAPDIIAITSERDLEMVRAAVAHGALAYLLKPFTFAAFRDRLERYRRYRDALPAGTDAASQAEVDRALAELRIAADRSVDTQGCGAADQRRDRPRGPRPPPTG